MNPSRKLKIALLVVVVGLFGLEAGERVSFPGVSGFVSSAEARVGRPLTPVSVAGVARRTTRRRASDDVRMASTIADLSNRSLAPHLVQPLSPDEQREENTS